MIKEFLTKEKKHLKLGEILAFAGGSLGFDLINVLLTSQYFFFITQYLGIDTTIAGIIIGIPIFFDAVNDPVIGYLADKTKSRYGKYRPYIFWSGILMCILIIFCFTVPTKAPYWLKVTWVFVSYSLFTIGSTSFSIPNASLLSTITNNDFKRNKLMSVTNIIRMIGQSLPFVIAPILINQAIKSSNSFIIPIMAVITGIIGGLFIIVCFIFTRERNTNSHAETNVLEGIKNVFTNKPLIILMIVGILNLLILNVSWNIRNFFFHNNLHDFVVDLGFMKFQGYDLGTVFFVLMFPFNVVSMILTPFFIKKFSTIKVYMASFIIQAITSFGCFALQNQNFYVVTLFMGIIDFMLAAQGICGIALIIECIDFEEYKTGKRNEGMFFSLNSLAAKVATSLSVFLLGISLTAIGYQQSSDQSFVQPAAIHPGIFNMFVITPAIAAILCVIVLFFYPLKGHDMEEIKAKLKENRKLANENSLQEKEEV